MVAHALTIQKVEGGFPHSEIPGSKLVRSSPRLIAAYHVLHRLSAPRHPPNALKALDRSRDRCPLVNDSRSCRHRDTVTKRPVLLRFPAEEQLLAERHRPGSAFAAADGHIPSSRCRLVLRIEPDCSPGSRKLVYPDVFGGPARILKTSQRTTPRQVPKEWWRQTGSNRRPHACKARALPAELCPRSPCQSHQAIGIPRLVGLGRLERPTSPLSGVRSNHLSYRPVSAKDSLRLEVAGRQSG